MEVSVVAYEIVNVGLLQGEMAVFSSLQSKWIEEYAFQPSPVILGTTSAGHISVLIIYGK